MHLDGTVHYNIDRICMFAIHSIQLYSFSMGTNENSKNIPISYDITSDERKKFKRKEREEENEKRRK